MNINNETAITPAETNAAPPDRPVFAPAADIYETPESVLIRCDMPGVAGEDLEITLSDKTLTLRGAQPEPDRGACQTHACEYRTGVYQRTFAIHRELDGASVKARLKNGVLEVELPKSKDAGPRRIPIEN